jgi:hypothetical protein
MIPRALHLEMSDTYLQRHLQHYCSLYVAVQKDSSLCVFFKYDPFLSGYFSKIFYKKERP